MHAVGTNGTVARNITRPQTWGAAPPAPARPRSKWRVAVTVAVGCAIPLACLFFAAAGGCLLSIGLSGGGLFPGLLGVAFFALFFTVLAVSLPHLARAVREIAGLGPRPAWRLAVALDCALAACELTFVAGRGTPWFGDIMAWSFGGFMALATLLSMALNCWTMLHHAEQP
jgi:hypothetical protein